MADVSTADFVAQFCPKPNHIKPCWCGGRAACIADTIRGQRCTRIVEGSAVRCWQHMPKHGESP